MLRWICLLAVCLTLSAGLSSCRRGGATPPSGASASAPHPAAPAQAAGAKPPAAFALSSSQDGARIALAIAPTSTGAPGGLIVVDAHGPDGGFEVLGDWAGGLTNPLSPAALLPDGSGIAAMECCFGARGRASAVQVVAWPGGAPRLIGVATPDEGALPWGVAVSPDGCLVAADLLVSRLPASPDRARLVCIYRLRDGAEVARFPMPRSPNESPLAGWVEWAADSSAVLLQNGRQLLRGRIDGRDLRVLGKLPDQVVLDGNSFPSTNVRCRARPAGDEWALLAESTESAADEVAVFTPVSLDEAPGSRVTPRLGPFPGTRPLLWSPSGAYLLWLDNSAGQRRLMCLDQSQTLPRELLAGVWTYAAHGAGVWAVRQALGEASAEMVEVTYDGNVLRRAGLEEVVGSRGVVGSKSAGGSGR